MFYFCRGLSTEQTVLLTHGDTVTQLAEGFTVIAKSGRIIAGMCTPNLNPKSSILVEDVAHKRHRYIVAIR